jgi:3-dehydroquinate dehydratase-2
MKILVINGPNIQLLGLREPDIYGSLTLNALNKRLKSAAATLDAEVVCFQSNHEGDIVDRIASALSDGTNGIVINPAAYTHTSIAIHDALLAVKIPSIEVHISNISARDNFRHISMTAPACVGMIAGLGTDGYEWALKALIKYLNANKTEKSNKRIKKS